MDTCPYNEADRSSKPNPKRIKMELRDHDQFELRNAHPEKSEISSAGTPRNALVHQGGAAEARTDDASSFFKRIGNAPRRRLS